LKERFISSLKKIKSVDLDDSSHLQDFEIKQLLESTGLSLTDLKKRASLVFDIALRDYDEIAIGTIDGFNHKLIRSFSRDLKIKSDFEVELDEANLFADAVDLLLEKVGYDHHITHHLLNYLRQSIDDDKKANITSRLNDLRGLISSEDSAKAVASLYEIEPQAFENTKQKLQPVISKFEKLCHEIGATVFRIFEIEGIEADDLIYKERGYYGYFNNLRFYNEGFVKLHGSIKDVTKPWHNNTATPAAKSAIERRQDELLEYYYTSRDLFEKLYAEYAIAKILQKQIDLLAVLADLSRELKALAAERNVVPISTFNSIISESMRNEPVAYIYEKFGNRYKHVLIDEFQDTSELQWNNITPFVADSLSVGQFNMVVGDAKQSIYRWRGGKAEQLIRLPKLGPDQSQADIEIEKSFERNAEIIPLGINYRSLPEIVTFNNDFIAELTSQLTSENSLFREEYRSDSASQSYPEAKDGGYISWKRLEKKAEPELVADQTIKSIKEAVADGFSFGDIAILVRKKGKEVNAIIKGMSEEKIPFTTRDSFGLDKNPGVNMLIAFMRLALNSDDATAQVKVMREISRLHEKTFQPQDYWQKPNYKGRIDLSAFLKEFSPDFSWKALAGLSAWEISKLVINRFVPLSERRDVSLESFLNCILERGGRAVSAQEFLEWWDSVGNKPEAKVGESGNRVQLMTIHKSKGLQFPVVILPNLNWNFSDKTETKWFRVNEKLNIPFKFVPLSVSKSLSEMGYSADFEQYEQENQFDNLNLIYVAVTRSAQRLYMAHSAGSQSQTGKAVDAAFEKLKAKFTESGHPHIEVDRESDESVESNLIIGRKQVVVRKTTKDQPESEIELQHPVDISVENRFRISAEGISPNREAGILFHDLAAQSHSLAEAKTQIDTWLKNGRILSGQAEELTEWVNKLYADEKYKELLAKATALAERSLVSVGKVLRPDMVFRSPGGFTVIDFKTGEVKESHKTQVREYLNAVESAENKKGNGFVVYLPEMKWVKVDKSEEAIQGTLF
jgi:ATP-dependent exoDNAse (exonuclease V) beta subunit